MSHECELCGQWCFCDQEDHGQPQPEDCEHFARDVACDRDCEECPSECDCSHCMAGESPDASEPDGSHG